MTVERIAIFRNNAVQNWSILTTWTYSKSCHLSVFGTISHKSFVTCLHYDAFCLFSCDGWSIYICYVMTILMISYLTKYINGQCVLVNNEGWRRDVISILSSDAYNIRINRDCYRFSGTNHGRGIWTAWNVCLAWMAQVGHFHTIWSAWNQGMRKVNFFFFFWWYDVH
jgi:hypothetical protein